jgi:hypothetical protein
MNEPIDAPGRKPPEDPRLRRDWVPPTPSQKPEPEATGCLPSTGCLFAIGFAGLVFGLCALSGR